MAKPAKEVLTVHPQQRNLPTIVTKGKKTVRKRLLYSEVDSYIFLITSWQPGFYTKIIQSYKQRISIYTACLEFRFVTQVLFTCVYKAFL